MRPMRVTEASVTQPGCSVTPVAEATEREP